LANDLLYMCAAKFVRTASLPFSRTEYRKYKATFHAHPCLSPVGPGATPQVGRGSSSTPEQHTTPALLWESIMQSLYDNSMTLALRRVALSDREVYTAARLVRWQL
jgi:hypothetical protein